MDYSKIMACILLIEAGLIITRHYKMRRINLLFIAVIYVMVVMWLTIFSRVPDEKNTILFSLFSAIKKAVVIDGGIDYYINSLFSQGLKCSSKLIHIRLYHLEGVVLNILLFIPMGYIVPVIWYNVSNRIHILFIAIACSFTIELLQIIWHLGIGELDDIVNNIIGALIGYKLYKSFIFQLTDKLMICYN